jgi:hypothetical protein
MMLANCVAHQNRLQMIAEAAVTKSVEAINSMSPSEAGGPVAMLGQLMKGLQLTPPPTE